MELIDYCRGCDRPLDRCRCSPNVAASASTYKASPPCPKCTHHTSEHHDEDGHTQFYCHHRTGRENNDFCYCEHGAPAKVTMMIYAIRSADGKWYRTYSNRRCAGWVKELATARIYTKKGQAQGKITVLANQNRKMPAPDLVEFELKEVNVIKQASRVEAARAKKQLEIENRNAAHAQWKLQEAQRQLHIAQTNLAKLQGK